MSWLDGPIDAINGAVRRVPNWVFYVLGALPFVWLVWMVTTGGLGPDPVKAIERRAGLWGLQFLIAALAVTPLRRLGFNLVKLRRVMGLLAFCYILLHLTTWIVLDMALDAGQIVEAVWKRPYILIGLAAFLAMIPLAVTSTNRWIKRLGPKAWQRLHQLTYAVGMAGAVHYLLLVKVISAQPVIYACIVIGLLATRLIPKARRVQTA